MQWKPRYYHHWCKHRIHGVVFRAKPWKSHLKSCTGTRHQQMQESENASESENSTNTDCKLFKRFKRKIMILAWKCVNYSFAITKTTLIPLQKYGSATILSWVNQYQTEQKFLIMNERIRSLCFDLDCFSSEVQTVTQPPLQLKFTWRRCMILLYFELVKVVR